MRRCAYCGLSYAPTTAESRYCSVTCGRRAWIKARQAENPQKYRQKRRQR